MEKITNPKYNVNCITERETLTKTHIIGISREQIIEKADSSAEKGPLEQIVESSPHERGANKALIEKSTTGQAQKHVEISTGQI